MGHPINFNDLVVACVRWTPAKSKSHVSYSGHQRLVNRRCPATDLFLEMAELPATGSLGTGQLDTRDLLVAGVPISIFVKISLSLSRLKSRDQGLPGSLDPLRDLETISNKMII